MPSFDDVFYHWLHWKLSFWQLQMQKIMKKIIKITIPFQLYTVTWCLYYDILKPVQEIFTVTKLHHHSDVIMSAMASQITGVSIVHSTVYSGADQRKHQISASQAFVRGIHQWPVNSPHKGPLTRKCFHLMTSSWLWTSFNALWPGDIYIYILCAWNVDNGSPTSSLRFLLILK